MEQQRIEIKDKYGKIYYMQSVRAEDAEELMDFVRLGSEDSCFFPWNREGCPKLWKNPSDYIIKFLEAPRMALLKLVDGNEIVGLSELAGRGYAAEFRHRFSLGTGIRKSHWGRGLAVSFNQAGEKTAVSLGYEQVEASTDSRNLRARLALEKNGLLYIWDRTNTALWQERIMDAAHKDYPDAGAFADAYIPTRRSLIYFNCNKFYRKSVIEHLGLRFDESIDFGEDRLFNYSKRH